MPFNQLTDAEDERLTLLAEECAEVIQAITKIQRHGYASRHPDGGPTNREQLEREIGHIYAAVGLLQRATDIDIKHALQSLLDKTDVLPRYLHHQGPHVFAHSRD